MFNSQMWVTAPILGCTAVEYVLLGVRHMVGWHQQLSGHEFEQTPGDGEGQGSLSCGSTWGGKESNTI